MTGQTFVSLPIPHGTGVPGRLWLALVISASCHWLLAHALAPEMPRRHLQAAAFQPMQVRVERLPVATGRPAAVESEASLDPGRSERPAAVAERAPAAELRRAAPAASPPALPQLPDPTIYTARDLDSYPRPIAPLDTSRMEDPAAGQPVSVRFELLIDEHGVVNEVVIAGPGPAGPAQAELRALLAATRFIPARKDGRAVKSRVLLNVSLVAKDAGR